MGSLIGAALARAQGFLLEPAAPVERPAQPEALEIVDGLQAVVTGLSRGSGATTVALALAQALVVPGVRSGHLISLGAESERRRGGPGVSLWALPPALRDPDEVADYGDTLARLAGGAGKAAVIWDVRADAVAHAAQVMESCDAVVCVADGAAEPALCTLVRDMLAERYGGVVLVGNRVRDGERWEGRCAVAIPESRLAAMLIARGRPAGGAMGGAVAQLASLVEDQARCR